MVKVYRYEHPSDTFGPYRFRLEFEDTYQKELDEMLHAHGDDDHPSISRREALLELGYGRGYDDTIDIEVKYGCVTLEDLDRWFDGYHDLLHKAGFMLAEYDVPEENVTKPDPFGQVAFISSH